LNTVHNKCSATTSGESSNSIFHAYTDRFVSDPQIETPNCEDMKPMITVLKAVLSYSHFPLIMSFHVKFSMMNKTDIVLINFFFVT
jgi:hypothetical protein